MVVAGVISMRPALNNEMVTGTRVPQVIPKGFPPPVYTYKDNPLTKEGIALGRKLFYDGRLSRDSVTSCASCHQQFAAFADYEHPFSHGFNNAFTKRNAPGLFNLAWHREYHLDGGINHLEVQPLAPLLHPGEMASSLDSALMMLKNSAEYKKMFKAAFGDTKITSQRMLRALAQFTGTIVSAGSKYDRVRLGIDSFNSFQSRGYELFKVYCNSCHKEPLFTDFSYRNIGLPLDTFMNDYGRMVITGLSSDSLKFKVPSLRNVARTPPYFHDGRSWGLTSAADHFRTATKDPNLDPVIASGKPLALRDAQFIVYFLNTLTDSLLLKDTSLSDPGFRPYVHFR